MNLEALSVARHECPCVPQHRLRTVLGDAGRVRIPVEDELADRSIARADVQDGDGRVAGEREQVAHQLEALGPMGVLGLLPSHPFFHVRLGRPVVRAMTLCVTPRSSCRFHHDLPLELP